MSKWRKFTNIVKKVAPIAAAVIPGGQGVAIAAATKLAGAARVAQAAKAVKVVQAVRTASTARNVLTNTGQARAAPVQSTLVGPAVGAIVRGGATLGAKAVSKIRRLPGKPGGGAGGMARDIAVGAGGAVAGGILYDQFGNPVRKRRRARGFSARDVRQAQRLMTMLKKIQAACPRPRAAPKSSGRIC